MAFAASKVEFENRFWGIGLLFFVGFALYAVDGETALNALAHGLVAQGVPDGFAFHGLIAAMAVLTATAALLRSWATSYLRAEVVHDGPRHSDRLVADGPYRYVRNPLYVGAILLVWSIAPLASRLGAVFVAIAVVVWAVRLAHYEEEGLLRDQGEGYRRYLDAVPRLIPALRPRVPPGAGTPDWRDGFLGEAWFWCFAGGMVGFAVTLSPTALWASLVVGFAVYFLQAWARGRR